MKETGFFNRRFFMAIAWVLALVFIQVFPEFQGKEVEVSATITTLLIALANYLHTNGVL